MVNEMTQYIGDNKRHTAPLPIMAHLSPKRPEPYIADEALINAVNMALLLRRPLLLEGEPGCGKTRLAYAIAYELGYPLLECYIRSTSHVKDLLYTYDALKRLYDVQMEIALRDARYTEVVQRDKQEQSKDEPFSEKFAPKKYVTLGNLGQAITLSQLGIPSVVLLDEIDKAEYDFPNDLLQLIEQMSFSVDEAPDMHFDALQGETREKRKERLPLFIITSNRERELPKPFLRRCLYYYIEFPNEKTLAHIVGQHFGKGITPLFVAALKQFWQLRQADFNWRKPPSTSELLDWLRVLEQAEDQGQITAADLEQAEITHLPYIEALVKTQSDRAALSTNQLFETSGEFDVE